MMNKFKNQIIKQMKKLTLITKMLVVLLVLNFSCSAESTDLIEEENSIEIETENNSQSNLAKSEGPCDSHIRHVYVDYNFTVVKNDGTVLTVAPFLQEQMKITFRAEMSQYFTICKVIESTCNDFERWHVSNDEYVDYLNNDPILGNGAGLGSIRPTGGQQNDLDCIFL